MMNQKTFMGKINQSIPTQEKHLGHIKKLSLLLEHYRNSGTVATIPTKVVAYALTAELNSKTLIEFCEAIPQGDIKNVKANELAALQKEVPEKLYFFLWRLRNNADIPVDGILNSIELRTAVYGLIRTIQILEHFAQKYPANPDIQEMCGFVYLDIAGLARHTENGILLEGLTQNHHKLVRKAIKYFQTGIKLCLKQGEKIDGQHYLIFDAIHEKYHSDERRINMYLNPWHFLYIACALNTLKDKKIACLYLNRARTIIDNIAVNQDPRVVSQKKLLEAIYAIINMSAKRLMLPQKNINHLQKCLTRINKCRGKLKDQFKNPIVETELLKQLALQQKQALKGNFPDEFKKYLSSIYSLYSAVPSSFHRNKIIFRLNLSPVKLKNDSALNMPVRHLQQNRAAGKLELIRGNSYRKAS